MHLSIASPPPPPPPPTPGDHRGFDRFALPGGGEFDHKVGYGGGAHWPTPVCTVISACTGWGCLTISSVPGWGFRIHLTPTLVKSPPSPGGGGGGGCTLGHATDRCISQPNPSGHLARLCSNTHTNKETNTHTHTHTHTKKQTKKQTNTHTHGSMGNVHKENRHHSWHLTCVCVSRCSNCSSNFPITAAIWKEKGQKHTETQSKWLSRGWLEINQTCYIQSLTNQIGKLKIYCPCRFQT